MPTATQEKQTKSPEAAQAAAYERWVQAELSKDPTLTALRVLYNDIRNYLHVKPETWEYFDKQEITGAAESLDTPHITTATGRYDPETDEIVAALAGGERVTYESFTVSGLERSKKRAEKDSFYGFQVVRDQIFHDNYHGPVKDMWHGQTDYDTVVYVSAFPEELLHQGVSGQQAINKLMYDAKGQKAFVYIFRRCPDGNLDFAAARLGNGLKAPFIRYLQGQGCDSAELQNLSTHQLGAVTVKLTTNGRDIRDVAKGQAAQFDAALMAETGQSHWFGQKEKDIDAYELFKKSPEILGAYRAYHYLLAEHLAGWPIDDALYDYLTNINVAVGPHVLDAAETARLGQQILNKNVTVDMALACKKIMTYAHYATLKQMHKEFKVTGRVTQLTGNPLESYGAAAGGNGGNAAARGEILGDCESTYGQSTSQAAVQMAAQKGISIEEAVRRLASAEKPREWKNGVCRNCERETKVGECSVCLGCEQAHTSHGNHGFKRERQKAMREREAQLALLKKHEQQLEESAQADPADDIALGTTKYIDGRKYVYMTWLSIGSATKLWVNPDTGKTLKEK